MITAITFFLLNRGLSEDMARRAAYGLIVLGVAVLLFVVLIAGRSCYVNRQIDKTQNEINEIRQEQSNATVVKDAVTIEAKEKEAETQKAREEREVVVKKLEDARKSDSSKEQSDAWAAMKRFCDERKDDSLCKDGRYK